MWFWTILVIVVAFALFRGVTIKSLAVGILGLFKRISLLWLKLRGLTPKDVTDQRIVTGKAWEEYCDTIKAAGTSLLYAGTPKDPFNQAEGIRYLSRLVRAGLENYLECYDPQAPVLYSIVDGRRVAPIKIGADNPDNLYQNASLQTKYSYRVYGKRGTVHYLGFGTQAGQYGKQGGNKTVDYKEAKDLKVDGDGNIEIILSVTQPETAKNWLRLSSELPDGLFIVRQTFLDREHETAADLKMERIGFPNEPSQLTPARVDEALGTAALLVTGASMLFAHWARGWQSHKNQLPLFDQETSNKAGGDPNIRYYHSYWELKQDEALVIDAKPPPCEHWNFQLNNYWMESLDYRYYTIHVNKHTARYKPDGSVRIIVAHSDPNKYKENKDGKQEIVEDKGYWINTTGHDCGTMLFRWIKPGVPNDQLNHPQTKVVKFDSL